MATQWISPTWRMPNNNNQDKFENYSLSLDGSNQFIDVDSDLFSGLSKFSVSFWYNLTNVSTDRAVIGRWSANPDAQILIYHQATSGYWRILFVNNSGSSQGLTTTFAATLDTWQFISFIYDGSTVSVQLNNETVQTAVATGSIQTQTSTPGFQIGAENGARDFNGELSQISIFNYSLSTSQREYLYNSGTPINPMAITGNAPIAYYNLGGSSTGSADDPANTLTVPNSSVPSATVFDFTGGSGEFISTNNATLLNGETEVSFNFWIKPKSGAANFDGIITQRSSGGAYVIINIDDFSGSNYRIFIQQDNGSAYTITYTTRTLVLDNWYQVCVKGSVGSKWDIYVNGSLLNDVQGTNNIGGIVQDAPLKIGQDFNGRDLVGEMSNVGIWNKNLSASEITTLYNNGVPLFSGTQPQAANLKAWYKLNVDTSTWNGTDWLISDSAITPTYTTAVELPNAFQNPPAAWPGLTRSDTSWSGTDITLSFWVRYPNGYDGAINYIRASGISIGSIGSTNLQFGSGTYRNFPIGNLQNKAWHNVVVYIPNSSPTFLISDVRCFIDGSEVAGTNIGSGTASQITTISGWGTNSGVGTSNLSNWTLFNSDLTGSISTLYNGGTPADVSSLNPVSWYKCDSTNVTFPSPGGDSMTFTDSSSNSNNATGPYDRDGIGGPFPSMTTTNVQAGDGTSSGMNTANLVNSDLTRSIPYSSYSMVLDGTDDYIDCGPGFQYTNVTVSCWVKFNTLGSFDRLLQTGVTGGGIGLLLTLDDSGGGNKITAGWSDATTDDTVISTLDVVVDTWYNVTFTRNASVMEIYIDGVDVSGGTSPGFSYGASNNLELGRKPGGSNNLDGNLSNVAIFNSVLSEDQITTIYNGGAPNDISGLAPASWWSLSGDSYFNGNDWICPDLGSNGSDGTSDNMGGTELVGDGPGSTSNGVASSMNIPADLKGDAPSSTNNAFSVNMIQPDRKTDVPPTP